MEATFLAAEFIKWFQSLFSGNYLSQIIEHCNQIEVILRKNFPSRKLGVVPLASVMEGCKHLKRIAGEFPEGHRSEAFKKHGIIPVKNLVKHIQKDVRHCVAINSLTPFQAAVIKTCIKKSNKLVRIAKKL